MQLEYFGFCPSLQSMLCQGTAIGRNGRRLDLGSCSTVGNLRILRELVISRKCTDTLEIGLGCGGSALAILATMRAFRGEQPFAHAAIDPFQLSVFDGVALSTIEAEGLQGWFTWIDEPSCSALPSLVAQGKKFDLIYIDGSHLFEDVFIDFYYASGLLKPQGVLLFDDCTKPDVAKVIRFISKNYSSILAPLDLDGYAGLKSLKRRIGALLGYRQVRGFVQREGRRRDWDAPFRNF